MCLISIPSAPLPFNVHVARKWSRLSSRRINAPSTAVNQALDDTKCSMSILLPPVIRSCNLLPLSPASNEQSCSGSLTRLPPSLPHAHVGCAHKSSPRRPGRLGGAVPFPTTIETTSTSKPPPETIMVIVLLDPVTSDIVSR